MRLPLGLILPVLALLPGLAPAQDVTLMSRDGGVEVSGELIGFDGQFYRLHTEFGDLTLDGTGVQCDGPGCPDMTAYIADIVMAGNPDLATRLMPALIAAFARVHSYDLASHADGAATVFELAEPGRAEVVARLSLAPMGEARAFVSLISGDVAMVLSGREPNADEISAADAAGLKGLNGPQHEMVVALDAIVPAVSPLNPMREIALGDLAAIYRGELTNWQGLTGLDAPIVLHRPGAADPATPLLAGWLAGDKSSEPDPTAVDADAAAAARRDPFALALVPLSGRAGLVGLPLTGGCGFAAHADAAALKSEDYPLTAPQFIYLGQGRLPKIGREFLQFTASPAAQVAIAQAGYVDQGLSRLPLAHQGDRLQKAILNAGGDVSLGDLQHLLTELQGHDRLSLTFRFQEGSTEPDAQSRSNIRLLAHALEAGTLGGRDLIFAGFSDGVGAAGKNRTLSQERAASIKQAVLGMAGLFEEGKSDISLRAVGFGEALPMACDDTAWGRQINRRVEVWLK